MLLAISAINWIVITRDANRNREDSKTTGTGSEPNTLTTPKLEVRFPTLINFDSCLL